MTFVNTKANQGGAALAAARLYDALAADHRYDLKWLAQATLPDRPDTISPVKAEHIFARAQLWTYKQRRKLLRQLLGRNLATAPEAFDSGVSWPQSQVRNSIPPCDIINLHWVSGLISPSTVHYIAGNVAPIVWTLHDMAAFTGGCHYDGGCEGYAKSCDLCPQAGPTLGFQFPKRYLATKRKAFNSIPTDRLAIVTPSKWLGEEVEKSVLGRFERYVIPNSVNIDEYIPQPAHAARNRLGLPLDRPILFFIADRLDSRRKGSDLFDAFFQKIRTECPDIFIAVAGGGEIECLSSDYSQSFGHVSNTEKLVDLYSASDITLLLSRQDNLPNIILESMACGTPVAGLDIGGVPDLVRNGKSGITVPDGDITALAKQVSTLLKTPDCLAEFSTTSRTLIETECAPTIQKRRYEMVFDSLLNA